ncbi:MAG: selenocysteine-specific translation elongation factor [Peptostreptococcaceae bacterium]|nr:selenocysteine-specific translation elongation factor [Peptostreptococcaceae bacterium]
MKHVIIGTAGHIDHGKTTLIKAMTGRDTDRLKEEKKRGITIELGFTYFDLPGGKRAGIIDVPGHEKFIKNMLAGVLGMDIVILVVAADEGIMPQTKEHMDILSFLNIPQGLIVLTKCDMADAEWIELVKEDIKSRVKGTFLENSEILEVDSVSGRGIEGLIEKLDEMSEKVGERDYGKPARIPIDRVFSLTGYGTIVTGTLMEGTINKGDTLDIYPSMRKAKIRNIQVHGEDMETVFAGQRAALNIAGIKKSELSRGEVIAQTDSMKNTMMVDVELSLANDEKRRLENWTRLRLYHGSAEIMCRLVLLDREILEPGETCYAQLRLEKTHAFKYGDLFVVRYYSPLETVGGGKIIDSNPEKHKRFNNETLESLELKSGGNKNEIIEQLVKKAPEYALGKKEMHRATGFQMEEIEAALKELLDEQSIYSVNEAYIHMQSFEGLEEKALKIANEYHIGNPYKRGVPREELKNKLLRERGGEFFEELLKRMSDGGSLIVEGHTVSLKNFKIELTNKDIKLAGELGNYYSDAELTPDNFTQIKERLDIGKKEMPVFEYLLQEGRLVKVSEELYYSKDSYEKILKKVQAILSKQGFISLKEFKDEFNLSRKYSIALLEHYDNAKITKRDGNKRIPF